MPEVIGAALGVFGALLLVLLQRRFDRQRYADEQQAGEKAAHDAELLSGVVGVWSSAGLFMQIADLLSDRRVQQWHGGALVGAEMVELQRAARELTAAATRLYLVADDEVIAATWKVLDAAQLGSGVIMGAPWWRPGLAKARKHALDTALTSLAGALQDLREVARVKLGRELPNLPDTKQVTDTVVGMIEPEAADESP